MATLAPSVFIESSSFLQVMRTCILAGMSLNFCQIAPLTMELSALDHSKVSLLGPCTVELAALERLKNSP